jgi:tetrahydromethanopterin S-methyltransferase subunit F
MYTFVTSFPKQFEKDYGLPMLESVVNKWKPTDFKLYVYLEGYNGNTDSLPQVSFITYRHIEDVQARNDFIGRNADKNGRFAEAPYNYRMDAVRFCNKVYAYTDLAFELLDEEYKGWLAWLDADTITKKRFTAEDAAKIMLDEVDMVHLGRIDIDYSETGFTAWNMAYHNACSHIVDMRGAYDTDEVFGYREWTDSFIYTRLLKIYEAHGARVRNLSEGVRGLEVFENCILNEHFTHNKGNRKWATKKESNGQVSPDVKGPKRYKQLADTIRFYSKDCDAFSIVETGTWNGGRAIEMALAAFENVDEVHYRGFDLFEEATEETDKEELNIKAHNQTEAVGKRLAEFTARAKEANKKFSFTLHCGNTKETMKGKRFDDVDFAYIDGGHSYDTVKNDYSFLKDVPVVVFDDYYSHDDKEFLKNPEYNGIIRVVDDIKDKNKWVLPCDDPTAFGGRVHIAVVTDKKMPPVPKDLTRVPIIVKPKDSMPVDDIHNNIIYNVKKIKDFDWVQQYKSVDKHAIVVSGGKINFDEVKKVQKETNAEILCVKHSYPRLLEAGIKPDACVILDPRPVDGISTHGIKRKDLFKTVDPSTTFIIASMTDISAVDYIMSKTDNVKGFHAFTGAIRDNSINDRFTVHPNLQGSIKEGEMFISGGTASATRAIGLLETLGYRNLHLFGFDCSMPEDKVDKKDLDEFGKSKYMHVETGGINFWTTGELLALAQDLEKMFDKKDLSLNIKFYGKDTLAAQVFEQSYYNQEYKTFDGFQNDRTT